MKSINDELNSLLSKIEEHVRVSEKEKVQNITLYFDDNILN
jgi:hypothetical protein